MSIMHIKQEDVFRIVSGDCKKVFGEDLLSVVLYGSGAGADYNPKRSDLNFLILLTEEGIGRLSGLIEAVKRWRKYSVATPLVISKSFLVNALDSYPVEFLNMKRRYRVVFGDDPLCFLSFGNEYIRLQIERELRGKLLHLRRGWLETRDNAKDLRRLIARSLTAFVSLFCALLYLKQLEIPEQNNDIIRAAAEAIGFDAGVFLACEDIRRGEDHFSSEEIKAAFRRYLQEVEKLTKQIDRLQTE